MIKELFAKRTKTMIGLLVGYILLVALIGFYQIEKRPVTVEIALENEMDTVGNEVVCTGEWNGNYLLSVKHNKYACVTIEPYELQNIDTYTIEMEGNTVTGVRLVRDGLYVKDLETRQLENGMLSYEEGKIVFSRAFGEVIRNVSGTVLLERLIICLGVTVIFLVILGLVIHSEWKKDETFAIKYEQTFYLYRFVKDIKKYGYYMFYAAKADLKAEVANSYLNWIWWILEPFCNMLVYTIVFSQVLDSSIEKFPVFIFSGLIMWNFFSRVINYSVKLVRNNKDIVTKVYVPKFILLLSNMVLNAIKLVLALGVLVVMMIIFDVKVTAWVVGLLPVYLILILFTFGAGMIVMHFGVFVDDLSYAINILLSMLMFLSGIFYDTASLEPALEVFVKYLNPVAMLIYNMRRVLIYGTYPELLPVLVWFVGAVLLCVAGIRIVYKNENSYVKVV